MKGRCDSFVVETDVHFPTDINLLFDALRKSIELTEELCTTHGFSSWRQAQYNIRQIKKAYWKTQRSKRSTSKGVEQRVMEAHRNYMEFVEPYLIRVKRSLCELKMQLLSVLDLVKMEEIETFVRHAEHQIDQIKRRVLLGESIPHNEKVFSLFEPHTEWICKGKLGMPVELGVRVCIMEDRDQFILHHRVMNKETDEKIALLMVQETKARYPDFSSVSYDRGFYSSNNRECLAEELTSFALPKKGKLSATDKIIQSSDDYLEARYKHAAVESAINALDVHGLDRCLDHGLKGFKRYVALAIVARNIQRVGAIIHNRDQRLFLLREQRKKKKAA